MSPSTDTTAALSEESKAPSPGLDGTAVVRHLAHELRQPLSTIESIAYYLDIVLPTDDTRCRQQVEKLQQVVLQANWLLSDAVYFLQASPSAPQLFNLNEAITDGLAEASHANGPPLEYEFSDQAALIRIDPDQARHLVRNVLFLFRQVARSSPRILTQCRQNTSQVTVEVSASEMDYTASELSAAEPFASELPAGAGLALATVRRIVDTHLGTTELLLGTDSCMSLRITFPRAC